MRVLLWGPFRGRIGTIEAVIRYAEALAGIGHEVVVLELAGEWAAYRSQFPASVRFERVTKGALFRAIGSTNVLRRRDFYTLAWVAIPLISGRIAQIRPDVIMAHLMAVPLILGLPKSFTGRLIVSIQGFPKFLLQDQQNAFYRVENQARLQFWRKLYVRCWKIFAMTGFTKSALDRALQLGDRVSVLSNPVLEGLPDRPLPALGRITDVVFVGRLEYQKDPLLFVDAAIAAKSSSPLRHLTFHMFGDGSLAKAVDRRLSEAGANLVVHGHVEDPWQHIAPGSVLLCTSRWDDPGHMILEAMWYGHPVLAVERKSGHIELVEDGRGMICAPSPEAILASLDELVAAPPERLSQMRNAARTYVKDRFTMPPFRRKLEAAIQ